MQQQSGKAHVATDQGVLVQGSDLPYLKWLRTYGHLDEKGKVNLKAMPETARRPFRPIR